MEIMDCLFIIVFETTIFERNTIVDYLTYTSCQNDDIQVQTQGRMTQHSEKATISHVLNEEGMLACKVGKA